jgi:hypothetical protein
VWGRCQCVYLYAWCERGEVVKNVSVAGLDQAGQRRELVTVC